MSAADEVKLAMCLVWRYIKDNNLWNKVKIVANIHDELVCNTTEDYAEEWAVILKDLMEQATTVTLPKGLLSAEVGISDMWSK